MAGPNAKVLHQARRALEARRNQDFNEWARLSVPTVADKIRLTKDPQVWLQGPDGESVAKWNGIFASDVLYERRADGLFANVLFGVEYKGESGGGEVYHYVQLLHTGTDEEWLYVQTVTASGDALAGASTWLRPTPEEAERAYEVRLARKAKKSAMDRLKAMTLAVPGEPGSADVSRASSVSDLGASSDVSYLSGDDYDVDEDDDIAGPFAPRVALSPSLRVMTSDLHTADDFVQQRRTREAMEQVRQTLSGVLALSTMLGLSQQQFMACVHDVCALTDSSPRLP